MIIKIDLEKAFGKLEWSFVRDTLEHFKFPEKSLILSYLVSQLAKYLF